MELHILLALIWVHFLADFLLQTDTMATKKSTDNLWLVLHVITYSLPLFLFGAIFAVVNGVLHLITDYITARATTYLYKRGKRHWFFVVIGLDQAIHISTLIITYQYLLP